VYIAAYNRQRWQNLDEVGKEHYRRLAEQERAVRFAQEERRVGPVKVLMKPFKY
jgi:hypothetical protein